MHEGPRAARAPPRAADAPTSYPMSILRGAAPPESLVLVVDVLPRACHPPLRPEQLASAVLLGGEKARGRPPNPNPRA